MTLLSGGEAVVQSLIQNGIRTLFAVPGVQNDHLFNALYDAQDEIKVIHCRHEQGAAYMALGHALATGEPAVFSIVPGPGFLNATAALATAYALNAKVFCLVGQTPTHTIGKRKGVLHEINNQLDILRNLTKWAESATGPAEVPSLIGEAFRQLHSGRPRPVGLEVPMDVLKGRTEVDLEVISADHFAPPVDTALVEKAAEALGQAKNPIIYVGSGALGASAEVRALAEMLQAPVVDYRTGRGVLDGRHPLHLFFHASHEYWKSADVALAIGSNMRIPLQKWGTDKDMTIIRLDVDPTSHQIFTTPDLAITARAEDALPYLIERTAAHNQTRPDRQAELDEIRAGWMERSAYLEPQKTYLNIIREELGEDGIFVDDLTQVGYAGRLLYPVYKPRTYFTPGYQGTLGYGFPTALGVKVAKPTHRVISITGDGGFMFSPQSLATAVQHNIGLVTILFNNSQYGNVQQMQRNVHGGKVIATDLVNPDFVKMAEAYGAQGLRADSPEQLREHIRTGFATDGPTLIEVQHGNVPSIDKFRGLPRVRG
ncbi:MAG: thiamine pyrophosphate-dependent enzyme [Candidatus Promineifilaceae bacterium]